MGKKFSAEIWQELSANEKKKAVRILNFNLAIQILLYLGLLFGIGFGLSEMTFEPITREELLEEGIIYIIIFISILFLFYVAYLTAMMLERKNINGKYGIFILLLIPNTIYLVGINLLLGSLLQQSIRKYVLRRVKPQILRKGYIHENNAETSFSAPSEENRSKALHCLSDGINLEKAGKYKEARIKYNEAYRLGDGRGAYYLARMLEEGKGCRVDIDESLRWEKRAADMDVSISQYYIGIEYMNGKHLSKNTTLGMSYLDKSAAQDEYDALFYLGLKYGSDLNKEYFDLTKAENYLVRAVKASETNEEKRDAYNELGRLWIGLWGETDDLHAFKMAVELFYKAKSLGSQDGIQNYERAFSIKPANYPSMDEIVREGRIDAYISSSKFVKEETIDEDTPTYEPTDFSGASSEVSTPPQKESVDTSELRSLKSGLLISSIIKIICFTAGLIIVLYGYNHGEDLFILTPFVIIGGVIIGGLPGLPKAFNDSYNYNKKWDKFFHKPEYKATVDYNKKTITVKKNDDWLTIIYVTLLNLLKTAIAAPFEAIRDIYRVFVISSHIKKAEQK